MSGVTLSAILDLVAERTGVTRETMLGDDRADDVSKARQLAMYLTRVLLSWSLPKIGREFKRHHSTVLYSIRKHDGQMERDADVKSRTDDCLEKLLKS